VKKHRAYLPLCGSAQAICEPSLKARRSLAKFFMSATLTGTGGLSEINS